MRLPALVPTEGEKLATTPLVWHPHPGLLASVQIGKARTDAEQGAGAGERRCSQVFAGVRRMAWSFWLGYRGLPGMLQFAVLFSLIGALWFSLAIGNMGRAAQGTAHRLSGAAVGAALGSLVAIVPWAVWRAFKDSYRRGKG